MSEDEIELLTACFFPTGLAAKADVAIVFGMSDPQRPVREATELFRSGAVRQLVFTGGFNARLGRPEAHEMARLAAEGGVPRDAMLIEDRARNTEENIDFSCRLLEDAYGARVGSIMLVTIEYHLRRACIAARRRLPADIELCWRCYESRHYTSRDWFNVEQGRRDVMAELEKIERYYGLTLADLARQAR